MMICHLFNGTQRMVCKIVLTKLRVEIIDEDGSLYTENVDDVTHDVMIDP